MINKIVFAVFFLNLFLSAQVTTDNLKTKLDSLTSSPFFDTAAVSIDVFDLTTNNTLYQKNNKLLLHPASNMKVLTTATALFFLGKDFAFETSLYYDGIIIDSTLYGNLYFVGGCDPDFTSADLRVLVSSIKDLGLNRIQGNIYGDVSMLDSLFWGDGWMWNDDPSTDFPYLTPLTINDNAVKVHVFSTEINSIPKITVEPVTSFFKIENLAKTVNDARTSLEITRDFVHRKNDIIVKGSINQSDSIHSDEINVVYPETYFLTLAKEEIEKLGISFVGTTDISPLPEVAKHLFTFKRKFADVIINLNKQSDNLSAEMTLRALAFNFYGKPATAENGISLIDSLITIVGMNPHNYRIVDGSGVSHYNLVSTELLNAVLKYFYLNQPELYETLAQSFPLAGVDGTLKRRMINTPAENNLRAKTGTISGVSVLSGYVTTKGNHQLSFSMMIQNHVRKTYRAVYFLDQICALLAELD
ncbi:MAG: D-alanyl-D-alanine carboxypeptidase/D-alanyl-D-alanine-endopeptidase [Ignavibacteriaceae bacterium]|jgi:D-alanyl-D-alanine carboxypeptidase/D-alanyl-D-alanine-endopeptidase (penicillin-binding protein 4)